MASMSLTRQRSVSNRQDAPQLVLPKGKDAATDTPFEPCAATASHFLFAQGSTVLVLHHDTLALERRFQSHTEPISLISVDNVSERGQGRLVVTYDVGKTAIIWDLFTGDPAARFASYEPLLVAAWMRNGNIAFGNEKGDVILFEPASSEHISARTIYDPITALAPSSDCKTYAIGYKNGSILLAALQPQFTILHTLNTSRSPSPIAMLTWHASSSKQKSDMLAIQNSDGDLRVWSVPKPPQSGQPRVIRILKRDDTFVKGRNWVSWSRNGRIIQFSEGETWSWDVRTKDVNYVPVPTIEYVKGIAAHGPTAALFTLGPEYTVQQYDADSGQMLAHVRHTPITIPPTPPEDYSKQYTNYGDELSSPLKPGRYEPDWKATESPTSTNSHTVSTTSRKSEKQRLNINELVSPAKTEKTATTFSVGAYTNGYAQPQSSFPVSPASSKVAATIRKSSRLRQEVVMSPMTPEDAMAVDLFPFARARLSEVQQQSKPLNESTMTPDDLRKHMLNVVFGWEDDIYALITDELARHPPESLSALFLSKWLDNGPETMTEIMNSTQADPTMDWIRLALGILDSKPEYKKLGQTFIEKMLSKGEIHMAAVVLLALGDKNDAIEVYVSNNYFLEAILMTCLLMPQEWQRQSHLVRKWGEFVVENSQQNLAIRCFACTGIDPPDTWMSPTAQMYSKMTSPRSATTPQAPQLPLQPQQPTYVPPLPPQPPSAINPHVSRLKGRGFEAPTPVALIAPPTPFRTAAAKGTRITPQTGGLKLITSFNNKPTQFKFPGLKTDDMTPINATNVTPIAESAIDRSALSPGGLGSYKMNNIASLNAAMSAGGLQRARLPSIGETPHESQTPVFPARTGPKAPPTPVDSGSDKEKEKLAAAKAEAAKQEQRKDKQEPQLTLLTSARYNPTSTPVQGYTPEFEPQTALRPSTSASWNNQLGRVQEESLQGRQASRNPGMGLSLQMDYSDPISRPNTTDSMSTNFAMSPIGGDGFRMKSPSVSGKSIDQYISSLDQAQFYSRTTRSRNSSRPPKEEKSDRKKSKHRKQRHSEDVQTGKRSPSSPVPMSPEDLRLYTNSVESFDAIYHSQDVSASDNAPAKNSYGHRESASTTGTGRTRHRSKSAQPKRRPSTRGRDMDETPIDPRGRSRSRKDDSGNRSPSSPLPMLPSDGENPAFKFVSQNRNRLQRSTSRRPERGTSARRDQSPDRRRGRDRSPSRQREYEKSLHERRHKKRDTSESGGRNDRQHQDSLDQLDAMAESIKNTTLSGSKLKSRTKEVAQAELEARRLSLARRPSAPNVPIPMTNSTHSKSASEGLLQGAPLLNRANTDTSLPALAYRPDSTDSRGRPGTPRGLATSNLSAQPEPSLPSLRSDSYQLPARTYSANALRDELDGPAWAPNEVPSNMPRHPAFDHRVAGSRATSRSRTRGGSTDRLRGKSVERPEKNERPQVLPEEEDVPAMIIGTDEEGPYEPARYRSSTGPTIIPELQHLAIPPPPPPPPAPPRELRIQTDLPNIASIPLPKSAYNADHELNSATPEKPHKRVSSRNEGGQLMGKLRGMIRSTSKPRDNITRSPNIDDGIMSPYETVTMMPPPLTSITERR